jgi:hypothetical protein
LILFSGASALTSGGETLPVQGKCGYLHVVIVNHIKPLIMKKIILGIALLATITASAGTPSPSVDEQLLKRFKQSFPQARKVTWHESGTQYEVYFEHGDIRYKVQYSVAGNVMSTIRYYNAKDLSPFILMKVKQRFGDKDVFGVTEVTTDEGVQYHIMLEDKEKWYKVVSNGSGQLMLERKFKKA